jgi:predicted phage tail protein
MDDLNAMGGCCCLLLAALWAALLWGSLGSGPAAVLLAVAGLAASVRGVYQMIREG